MVASLQKYQKQYFFVFTFCHYLLLVLEKSREVFSSRKNLKIFEKRRYEYFLG